MKQAIIVLVFIVTSSSAFRSVAQSDTTKKSRKRTTFSISNKGVALTTADTSKNSKPDDKQWSTHISMDLGVNFLQDNTNYTSPGVRSFLNVPATKQNSSLFDLRQGKSINVNIYPWMKSFRALKTPGQRIFISTGLGLQLYNFRYDNNITYTRNPASITQDTISFSKNKLALDYLNVPLLFTFKTRLYQSPSNPKKNTWLVYGAGITEGYAISTWTKQVSSQRGKVKVHDNFDLAPFNTCITADLGIEDVFRFYVSYQLTSLYTNGIDQHPVSFGIRFLGL